MFKGGQTSTMLHGYVGLCLPFFFKRGWHDYKHFAILQICNANSLRVRAGTRVVPLVFRELKDKENVTIQNSSRFLLRVNYIYLYIFFGTIVFTLTIESLKERRGRRRRLYQKSKKKCHRKMYQCMYHCLFVCWFLRHSRFFLSHLNLSLKNVGSYICPEESRWVNHFTSNHCRTSVCCSHYSKHYITTAKYQEKKSLWP